MTTQTQDQSTVEGFKNWETAIVAHYFDDSPATVLSRNKMITIALMKAPSDEAVSQGTWTVDEAEIFILAGLIRDYLEMLNGIASGKLNDRLFPGAAHFIDLLNAAIQRADHCELARGWIAEEKINPHQGGM